MKNKRVCGNCTRWKFANTANRRRWGICTAKQPVWTLITGDVAPYATDPQAKLCACYRERKIKS
jgi:hypothetical protein